MVENDLKPRYQLNEIVQTDLKLKDVFDKNLLPGLIKEATDYAMQVLFYEIDDLKEKCK